MKGKGREVLEREADRILEADASKQRKKTAYWKRWGKKNTPPRGKR